MCKMSPTIGNIAMALVKFNGEVETITKDAKNPHFKNKYASLDNIIEEIRPVLSKHGITVMQIPSGDGETVSMKTMLLHESGEWMESEPLVMRPVKNDPQGVGSCITYARRYSLCSMLSLSTGEDDDGNHASQPQRAAQSAPQGTTHQPSGQRPPASTGQSNAPHSFKRDVYNLRESLFMNWNELQSFSERVLGRKINGKITALQDEKEWELIAKELKTYQHQPAGV
ncbi:ERF family protein [Paenibacillus spongiae]|uniref:ERF family protein n=1 Tax=Paenibacillus spongiae TaxID=2909671 RepID=A0ABY5SB86_9BACL|nr:ERF family protein [Paenibacillus spongiae]UVI31187.1 ERF family protein [Paenibacillus spongiae]